MQGSKDMDLKSRAKMIKQTSQNARNNKELWMVKETWNTGIESWRNPGQVNIVG